MHKILFSLYGLYPLSQLACHEMTATRILIVVGPSPRALLTISYPIALH